MEDCDYCEASFEDEAAYLDHLRTEHADELGAIDRRRVGMAEEGEDGGLPTGPVVLGGVVLVGVVLVVWGVFLSGGSGSSGGPTDIGSVHYHGTLVMVVDGERVDFSRDRYQLQARAFHFEGGNGTRWHVHAKGVTLAWAMDSLGIEVTETTVTFRGRTYDADAGDTVRITVDGEPVVPSEYVLQRGDEVRIVVESG